MNRKLKSIFITTASSLLLAGCGTAHHAAKSDPNTAADMPSAAQHVYNLTADWSDNENPNGVWSYNHNDSPITQHQTFWWGQAGWGYISIGDGCVIKGSYPEGMNDPWGKRLGPAHDWRPGDVMMHALSRPYGGETKFVNVKWTSPADGTIDVSGRAWDGEIFPECDVGWSLIAGGKTLAQRSSVRGICRGDRSAKFGANRISHHSLTGIPVTQGAVVELRVVTATYYGHFVGVEEQITLKAKAR